MRSGSAMKVRRSGDWLAAKVGNDLVMMSAKEGNYIGLNEVGSRIWELLDEPRDVDDICTQLQAEFAVPRDVCFGEVQNFLKELEGHGAIVLAPAE